VVKPPTYTSPKKTVKKFFKSKKSSGGGVFIVNYNLPITVYRVVDEQETLITTLGAWIDRDHRSRVGKQCSR
jgi:PII-like signaling protein